MKNEEKASRILRALDACKATISWNDIDEPDLIEAICIELRKIEKEENKEK